MKKKILNTDDNDMLNLEADARNDGDAVNQSGDTNETVTAEPGDEDDDELPADQPLPDEIAFPEEQEDEDEMA